MARGDIGKALLGGSLQLVPTQKTVYTDAKKLFCFLLEEALL